MKKCRKCGYENSDQANYCRSCASPLNYTQAAQHSGKRKIFSFKLILLVLIAVSAVTVVFVFFFLNPIRILTNDQNQPRSNDITTMVGEVEVQNLLSKAHPQSYKIISQINFLKIEDTANYTDIFENGKFKRLAQDSIEVYDGASFYGCIVSTQQCSKAQVNLSSQPFEPHQNSWVKLQLASMPIYNRSRDFSKLGAKTFLGMGTDCFLFNATNFRLEFCIEKNSGLVLYSKTLLGSVEVETANYADETVAVEFELGDIADDEFVPPYNVSEL